MPRWIMVIDLGKCIGCDSCVASCSYNNQLPIGISWRRVVKMEAEIGGVNRRVNVPMSCMHCANPPCRDVCPTGATHRHADGIVDIDPNRCVGCGFCVVACPYLARSLISTAVAELSSWTHTSGGGTEREPMERGVCTKCDMCRPKIMAGLAQGLKPGVDTAATPTCVNTCPWGAIHFGDADDPNSSVSRLLVENDVFRMNEELGTEPSIYYIHGDS